MKDSIERHRFFGMPLHEEDQRVEAQVKKTMNETAKSDPLGKKTTKKDGEHTPE